MYKILNLCWDLIYCKRSTVSKREGFHLWRMTSWLFSEPPQNPNALRKKQTSPTVGWFYPGSTPPPASNIPTRKSLQFSLQKQTRKLSTSSSTSVSKDLYILLLLCHIDASSCLTTSWSHSLGFSLKGTFCKHLLISARTEPLNRLQLWFVTLECKAYLLG